MSNDLKQSRLDKKLSLERVAEDLKIRKQYISALEDNDLDSIPGKVYARGYLKMYQEYLGLEQSYNNKPKEVRARIPSRNEVTYSSYLVNTNSMLLVTLLFAISSWYFLYHRSHNQSHIIELLENIDHTDYLVNEKQNASKKTKSK